MSKNLNNSESFYIKQPTGEKFDFSSMYQQLPQWKSGGQVLSFLTLIDVDGDREKELLFQFWQIQEEFGKIKEPSVSNLIKIYKLQSGNPVDITEKIFKKEIVQLEGAGASVVYDINKDGREDWFIAANKEDGRPYPAENNFAPTIAIISQSDGSYKIINSEILDWGGSIGVAVEDGTAAIISTGWHNQNIKRKYTSDHTYLYQSYIYKYNSGNLLMEMGPPLNPADFLQIDYRINGKKTYLTTAYSNDDGKYYLHLIGWTGNDWMIYDGLESSIKYSGAKDFMSWQMSLITKTNIYELDGYQLADVRTDYIDRIEFAGSSKFLFVSAGSFLQDENNDGIYMGNGEGVIAIEAMEVVGEKLKAVPINLIDKNGISKEFKIIDGYSEIMDINRDGVDDIIANPYTEDGNPIVYLGIGNGSFYKIDDNFFPMPKDETYYWGKHARSKFIDINNDSIYDIFYWAGNGVPVNSPYNKEPVIFYGSHNDYGMYVKTNIKLADRFSADKIVTFSGNDKLSSNGSNKVTMIDMGSGIDTISYNSILTNKINYVNGAHQVAYAESKKDILFNVERLEFSNKSVALDLDASAGEVAKILGAVFGSSFVNNEEYFGIGLYYKDSGTSYADLSSFAAAAAGLTTNDQLVSRLWLNVVGTQASASDKAPYIKMLEDGMSYGELIKFAAETDLNKTNIDLVGLAEGGADYIPFNG